jgi:hypothetical protein
MKVLGQVLKRKAEFEAEIQRSKWGDSFIDYEED